DHPFVCRMRRRVCPPEAARPQIEHEGEQEDEKRARRHHHHAEPEEPGFGFQNSLPYSIAGQRSMTTVIPAACARAAARSSPMPSCVQKIFAPFSIACSTISATCSDRRKTSTISIGPGTSRSEG